MTVVGICNYLSTQVRTGIPPADVACRKKGLTGVSSNFERPVRVLLSPTGVWRLVFRVSLQPAGQVFFADIAS
jgi:hypothetical protein